MELRSVIDRMSLRDKVAFCSGGGAYSTKALADYGIPSILLMDGPHGIRKVAAGSAVEDLNRSTPATCFPAACLTACSWDRALLYEMGAAIAEEALQEGISVVLGPGVNIKRNPLCGRNFEYFSEDPFLAGELAASWIQGLQSKGVGASLKHFAANNQETDRMTSDSLVDERALHEVYLPAFERAVKAAKPATVMCAYNRLNGIYCSDHVHLLREILRDEWGFDGVVVTDWGAMNDRVKAFEAGVDLEMPDSSGWFDETVIEAIQRGDLAEELLDESVGRLLTLIESTAAGSGDGHELDADRHHQLAKKIAVNSAVLLKNTDQILPIAGQTRIALIGALARAPRYQGAGSSHINPTQLSSAIDGFQELGLAYTYHEGYPLAGPPDETLLADAIAGARSSDIAVIFAGLPDSYESEGFDRTTLSMPDSQNWLISQVAEANPNTVVVLCCGAPVEMPWAPKVKAILHMYLPGQAGGLAAAELLAGVANPSGKLAESYPLRYDDVPSAGFYETGGKQAQYREGLYVGYRYYDSANQAVLFPFGHGLSYTVFAYSDLALSSHGLHAPYSLSVSVVVTNIGPVTGAEVVQLYVGQSEPTMFRPRHELKGFAKVRLEPGEAQRVSFALDARSFAAYDARDGQWVVADGEYRIAVGASSRDIRLQDTVAVRGVQAESPSQPAPRWYRDLEGRVTQADFQGLYGKVISPVERPRKGEYTIDCSFRDLSESFIGRQVAKNVTRSITKQFGGVDPDDPTLRMIITHTMTTPLRRLSQMSPELMSKHIIVGVVHLANGKLWRGLTSLLSRKEPR